METFNVAWLKSAFEGAAHHGLALLIVSVVGLLGGCLLHWWRRHQYGCLMNVVVCRIDSLKTLGVENFSTDTIWEGQATDFVRDLAAAKSLTRSSRRMRGTGLLQLRKKDAQKILTLCANQIRQQFAAGFIAKAMDDEGVTERAFILGLFKDPAATAPVTLFLITTADWVTLQSSNKVHVDEYSRNACAWAKVLDEKNSMRLRLFM
jgi:hypothetical protein